MAIILHPERTRGFRDMGWIQLYQSFNPGQPPTPDRARFGQLVIFDNGIIAPGGKGFGMHPHRNMEIASIIVSGTMEHSDSASHQGVALTNSVQLISAGSGVAHSEFNHSPTEPIDNLQIWFLPKTADAPPRYQRMASEPADRLNRLQLLLAPEDTPGHLVINQDAYVWRGTFAAGTQLTYARQRPGNGLYLYVIDGRAEVAGHTLAYRDAVGLTDADADSTTVAFSEKTDLLVIDVPQ